MFRDRHDHSCNIHLLETVFSQKGQANVAGNSYKGDRIHVGCGDAGDQIGSPRSAGSHTHSYLSCRTGVTVRRMGCSLLMGSQHMMDLSLVFI